MSERKLCSKSNINERMQAIRKYISGKNKNGMPRFGLLSLVCEHTPFIAFDHESIADKYKTAFTDYTHTWYNANFIEDLLIRSAKYHEQGEMYNDVIFIALHELSHIAHKHNKRLSSKPHRLTNIATDIEINTGLLISFKQIKISPYLANMLYGTSQEYREKFTGFSSEAVYDYLAGEVKKQQDENDSQSSSNDNESNSSQSGGEQPQDPSQDSNSGDSADSSGDNNDSQNKNDNNGDSSDKGEDSASPSPSEQKERSIADDIKSLAKGESGTSKDHNSKLEEVIKLLEDAEGIDEDKIKDLLGLPDSSDKSALDKLKQSTDINIINDIGKARQIAEKAKMSGTSFPGQHILDAAEIGLVINDESVGQWKHKLFDLLKEDSGLKFTQTDDSLNMEYHIGMPLDVGADLRQPEGPEYLIIVDSSGSTANYIDDFFSEAIGMLEDDGALDVAPTLHIMSADTTARGVVYTLDESNKDDIISDIKAFGGGGTDFESEINDCYIHITENEIVQRDIDAIILLTDLGDFIPKRENLPENLPPVVFMCPPSLYREAFNQGVKEWAEVIPMDLENSYEVDLEEVVEKGSSLRL
jgi:hypothetical protein